MITSIILQSLVVYVVTYIFCKTFSVLHKRAQAQQKAIIEAAVQDYLLNSHPKKWEL